MNMRTEIGSPETRAKIFLFKREFFMRSKIWFFFFLAASFAAVFFSGVTSRVFLGDEIHHYRFAKDCFRVDGRAAYDAAYGSPIPPGFLYTTDPAWPLAVSWIWKAMGRVSFPAAQFYHGLFYSLLLISVYGLGKHFFGEREGIWAALILGTMPMIATFSVLFYTDVPATALVCVSLFFLMKRRCLVAGIILAVSILMKRSMAFFLPAFGLILLSQNWRHWLHLLVNGAFYFVPGAVGVALDMAWRREHLYPFQGWTVTPHPADALNNLPRFETAFSSLGRILIERSSMLLHNQLRLFTAKEYTNSFLLNPADLIKYCGPFFLGLLLLGFFLRLNDSRGKILWLCLGSYFICFILIFHLGTDIRYVLPLAPFLALFAGRMFEEVRKHRWSVLLIAGMLCQLAGTLIFINSARRPSPLLMEGFNFIKSNLPPNAVVFYPEANLTEYTERPMIWSVGGATRFFWASEIDTIAILDQFGIDYILVKKSRTYDDRKSMIRHVGGFPQSFLNRFTHFNFIEGPVFENSELSLWKVKHLLPPSSRQINAAS